MYAKILHYVLMYFLYSSIGWTVECTYRSLGERRIINSGFLYGPMCPIYGTGALVFEILVKPFAAHWWAVLLLGILFADAVEYLTSYLMEKLFHARWWDYSNEFLNINGRICFKHTCYWALFSVLYVYFISPIYDYALSFVPMNVRHILVYVILAIFAVDLILTVKAVINIQQFMSKLDALRQNVNMAADVVKLTAEGIKDSAEIKYREFSETVAQNSEKLEEWRGDVSERLAALRTQLEDMTSRQRSKITDAITKRLFYNSTTMKRDAEKNVNALEEKWKEIKDKFKK